MNPEVNTAEDAAVDVAIIDAQQHDADVKAYVPTPFDDLAKEMGWFPPDEYNGDADKWRSAEDYIKHGVQSTKSLKRDLKAVKDTADRLARTSATLTAKALEDQRAELEARHDQAVEDGDKEAARAAAKDLARLDDAPDLGDVKTMVKEFTERNDWYTTHEKATDLAAMVSKKLANQGKDVSEQLEAAEEAVRERFPELFEKPKKAPAVHGNQSRVAVPASREKGVADLPAEARRAGEDYVKMINARMPNAKYTLKDFSKTYWEENS